MSEENLTQSPTQYTSTELTQIRNMVISEMCNEAWAMDEKRLENFLNQILNVKDLDHLMISQNSDPILFVTKKDTLASTPLGIKAQTELEIKNNIAIIPVKGLIMKNIPWIFELFGIHATAIGDIQNHLKAALGDDSVKSILFHIASPGGLVSGMKELSDDIFAAAKEKPINAFIEDLGASGAYWIASQAGSITANNLSKIGSIGVYTVLYDMSKMASDMGIKVNLVRSGDNKGVGEPGVAITKSQLKPFQRIVDGIADIFKADVLRGRNMSAEELDKIADGRVFLDTDALANGLIDKIGRIDDALAEGQPDSKTKTIDTSIGVETMVDNKELDKAQAEAIENTKAEAKKEAKERLTALHAAFPEDPEFVISAHERDLTIEQAKAEYADVLKEKLKESEEATKTLQEENATLKAKKETTSSLIDDGDSVTGGGDFIETAKAIAKEKGTSYREAASQLAKDNLELHKKYKASLGL